MSAGGRPGKTAEGSAEGPRRRWRELIHPNELGEPCALGHPDAFSDEQAGPEYFKHWPDHDPACMGPNSEAVARRLASSCAGWAKKPTAAEFYEAIRAQEPTERQKVLLGVWAVEATSLDLFDAWGEQVYTWRSLAAALHRVEHLDAHCRFRELNRMATVGEYEGIDLWTS